MGRNRVALVTDVHRFDVYLVGLDPTVGTEMRNTRPCVVVSPDEMNRHIRTIIVAPLTTVTHGYPTRVPVRFQRKSGEIALDRIRTIDKSRLVRRLGAVPRGTATEIARVLVEMFRT